MVCMIHKRQVIVYDRKGNGKNIDGRIFKGAGLDASEISLTEPDRIRE